MTKSSAIVDGPHDEIEAAEKEKQREVRENKERWPTSVPSGILIHAAVWHHNRRGPKIGGSTLFGGGGWVPI